MKIVAAVLLWRNEEETLAFQKDCPDTDNESSAACMSRRMKWATLDVLCQLTFEIVLRSLKSRKK
jgi:hypothetical protein